MFRMWIVGEQTWQWVQWIQRQLCVSHRHPEVREIEILRKDKHHRNFSTRWQNVFSFLGLTETEFITFWCDRSISNIYESDSCLAWSSIIAELEGNFPLDWFPTSGTWGTESIWTQVKQCFRCHIFRRKVSRSRTLSPPFASCAQGEISMLSSHFVSEHIL